MKILLAATLLLGSCMTAQHNYQKVGKIQLLESQFASLIDTTSAIEILADGLQWAEGPVWNPKGKQLLFSDPRMNTIFQWDEKNGLQEFLKPSGYEGTDRYSDEPGTNGLLINTEGDLIACDHGNRRITKINLKTKEKQSLVDQWEGKKFNSPNDICQAPDGTYYFTDPPYGLPNREADTSNRQIPENGVYHVDKNGNATMLVSNLARPNGIAISADGTKLFVALSDGGNPYIMAYTISEGKVIGEGEKFIDFKKHFPEESLAADGIKIDRYGNLYAAAGDGVIVFNPEGKPIGRIRSGVHTANCAFGADGYLYMTASDKILRVKLK